jgi:hypothetical protein
MSSSSDSPEPEPALVVSRQDRDCLWWASVLQRLGMTAGQAEALAFAQGCDRHAVRDALERGCDPDLAFLIYS